ncbi:hypothetical protein FB45DRAFT_354654 [Roridomyces roridus]|uniref:F-box domain-containing protein n=1 Tax=Roridomyces roridus TaxID=1738132 RepID=A0AAD7FSY5_9AGAR|nr:hypothetical protein FB45DRAFT_354654 [Roridomyces roridus]
MASPMFPLVEDVIGRILTFCPDFATLHAVVRVSKQFHAVYQTHPKSITQAVAYNIVGPALPAALCVLRYPLEYVREDSDPLIVASACVEESAATMIAWDEKIRLVSNAEEIAVLEDVYSITSVLTAEESHRFHRAAYRAELFSAIFTADTWALDDIDELEPVVISNIQEQRAALLNGYDTRELLEMFSFVRFMRAILKSIVVQERHIDILLTAGPTRILEAWEEESDDLLWDSLGWGFSNGSGDTPNRLFDGYYARAFAKVWEWRKDDPLFCASDEHKDALNPPTEDDGGSAARWLLSEMPEANDTCSHCSTRGGLELLTEVNWHLHPISHRCLDRLKSRLTDNPTLVNPVNRAVAVAGRSAVHLAVDITPHGSSASIFRGGWISAVFDFAQTAGEGEFASWSKEDSYCASCLGRFLDENVWRWLLAERVCKDGWAPPEDCWYGYNCRTQTHKRTHATGKNHLAVPTRGDD